MTRTWDEVYKVIRQFSDFPVVRYEKCRAIFEMASEVKTGCIVELGTYIGLTAITMALASSVPVHTIDKYINHQGWTNEDYRAHDRAVFENNLAQSGADVILHVGDAHELAQRWIEPIGLLFWDIGGSRLADDFQDWQDKVLTGGFWVTKDIDGDGFGHRGLEGGVWCFYRDYPHGLVYAMRKHG